jgi:predicted transcriptional regulator
MKQCSSPNRVGLANKTRHLLALGIHGQAGPKGGYEPTSLSIHRIKG